MPMMGMDKIISLLQMFDDEMAEALEAPGSMHAGERDTCKEIPAYVREEPKLVALRNIQEVLELPCNRHLKHQSSP